jgi:penicillin amidase
VSKIPRRSNILDQAVESADIVVMRRALVFALPLAVMASCTYDDTTGLRSGALPREDVRLVVDRYGITHVYATDDADAFYGAGYAMARDRLFQMELGRRRAKGTLAEVLGPTHVKDDIGARTLGFLSLGVADLARARAEHPEDARMLDAWVAGVNARIAEVRSGKAPRPYGLGPGELDFVPDDWKPEEPEAIAKVLSFGLSSSLDAEILATLLLRLAPDFASRYPLVRPSTRSRCRRRGCRVGKRESPPRPRHKASRRGRRPLRPTAGSHCPKGRSRRTTGP